MCEFKPILDNFLYIEFWIEKKVSFSKRPPTPFRQSPPKQQGSWNHTFLRGKDKQTNVVLKRLPERRQRKTETRQSTVLRVYCTKFMMQFEYVSYLEIIKTSWLQILDGIPHLLWFSSCLFQCSIFSRGIGRLPVQKPELALRGHRYIRTSIRTGYYQVR